MSPNATQAALASRRARFAPHAIQALVKVLRDGKDDIASPIDNARITLTQVTNQITFRHEGHPLVHLPLSIEDARAYVAVQLLDSLNRLEDQARRARERVQAITNAQLVPTL